MEANLENVDKRRPAAIRGQPSDRWRVVPLILQGVPYREIHDRTLVSVTTIGRVARTLDRGAGGYATAIEQQGGIAPASEQTS